MEILFLLSVLTTGFAKKTFISYSVTFGDSFRQGKVVGIDPERQQVLLSDGEVGGTVNLSELLDCLTGLPADVESAFSRECCEPLLQLCHGSEDTVLALTGEAWLEK